MKPHHRFYLLLLSGLLCAVTACRDNMEERPHLTGNYLQAVIANDASVTRSIVIDNPGVRMESYWTGGDRIGVFGQGSQNVVFSVTDADILKDGKVANFKSAAEIPSGELTAYHPYSAAASINGKQLTLTMAATQTYTKAYGVPQPDPTACVMVGSGTKGGGIAFHNVMAVLKIGQAFGEKTTIKKVVFRDLSGKPVSGTYTVNMENNAFATEFTGSGKDITLNMGEGVTFEEGSVGIVFLVVPARNYPQGFEITFIDDKGKTTVRTVGTKQGKQLNRSVVHPIGDITNYQQVKGIEYELKPTARVMTPENLDLVKVVSGGKFYVYTDDGEKALNADGTPLMMPELTMSVHKDLKPVVGGWLIFNMPTSDLPTGGVYKIKTCKPSADGQNYQVFATAEANFAAPFAELSIGKPMFDDKGNIIEDSGIELDLSGYVKEIRDGDGNVISSMSPARVPTYDMNAAETLTRGSAYATFTSPMLSLDLEASDRAMCNIGARVTLKTRLALGIMQGELQYIYYTINPHLDLRTAFALYQKFEKKKNVHLIELYCPGIPIGPVLVTPSLGFSGEVGIGGEAKFSTSVNFNYDLGTHGVSYNRGDGLTFRKVPTPDPPQDNSIHPQFDASFSGSLYAYGGIGISAGISVYGLCSVGLNTMTKLTFGIEDEYYTHGGGLKATKLAVTPSVEIVPFTAVIGGRYMINWKGLTGKIDMNPLWERYITPEVVDYDYRIGGEYSEEIPVKIDGYAWPSYGTRVPMNLNQVSYKLKLKGNVLNDVPIVVDLYKGSNIVFSPSKDHEEVFSRYQSSGVAHLFPLHYICDVDIINPELQTRYIVNTYPAGQDSLVIEGVHPISTSPGVPYAIRLGLLNGDKLSRYMYSISHRTGMSKNFIYYWPDRANGKPYYIPPSEND